ncbi:hypothetical protein [Granulicoccus sp. GXG6511]|uniref:hypothetical protein n=1 Tax=Granulicoccus sp. GXG6511 TaxID=3381351 RepID=UPI003D7D0865
MRKPLKSLVAATGAAFILTAGVAAPALAAPADPLGTSENVTVDPQGFHALDMRYTFPSGGDTRGSGPWSCGLARIDGWSTAGNPQWRLAFGAAYDMPDGFLVSIPASSSNWTIDEWEGDFAGYGAAGTNPSRMNTDPTFDLYDDTNRQYSYMTGQAERVHVTRAGDYINIDVDSMAKDEYFNLTLTGTPVGDVSDGDSLSATASVFASCEVEDAATEPPASPKPPKKVNSGGVETGASGLAAIALGASAIGGLALYGRNRAKK